MSPKKKTSARIAALTEAAQVVLKKRYLLKDDAGAVSESPSELFQRVATAVAQAEARNRKLWAERFFEMMADLRFLPNTPTLMNAGKPQGQLSACFVLPIEDGLESIFDALKEAALIHQSGGGTGFAFSRLRAKGSRVHSSDGVAAGPVSFLKIFDVATDAIKQGGARRGANMGVLRVDHPDIFEFIEAKRSGESITNFNLSVGATKEFMRAVVGGEKFSLVDPVTKKKTREVLAEEIFQRMIQAAWECGDPGLVFLDRMNAVNPTPNEGAFESTNPCGEQPLLPYESCNLGSLNLGKYVSDRRFDWEQFKTDIHLAVRFLDNVIEVNCYPISDCEKITKKNRKIGLGVMGFADALLELNVAYDSTLGLAWGERIMGFLNREARAASAALAVSRGAFPNWKSSLWKQLGYPKLRNATVSTIAPTGTISIIAGASSGIEPVFSASFVRNVLSGERLPDVHPWVERKWKERGWDLSKISMSQLNEVAGGAWRSAKEISVLDHVKMQAVFQRHSDSAVSKTINLPNRATPKDVAQAYLFAYKMGCKGITVYRDGSKAAQVLEDQVQNDAPSLATLDCDVCD